MTTTLSTQDGLLRDLDDRARRLGLVSVSWDPAWLKELSTLPVGSRERQEKITKGLSSLNFMLKGVEDGKVREVAFVDGRPGGKALLRKLPRLVGVMWRNFARQGLVLFGVYRHRKRE